MQGRKTVIRIISGCTALLVILVYTTYSTNSRILVTDTSGSQYNDEFYHTTRHLLDQTVGGRMIIDNDGQSCNSYGGSVDNSNCSKPLHHGNDSCQFVRDQCSDDVTLFNYLSFVVCYLPSVKVYAYYVIVVVVVVIVVVIVVVVVVVVVIVTLSDSH